MHADVKTGSEVAASPPASGVRFSLIVCTLGRRDTLRRLFESLRVQTFKDFEVVLVDQNTSGLLDDLVRHYRSWLVIVHVTAEPGLSAARNIGLDYARGDIIAFPDDDCWYDPDTLADVLTLIGPEDAILAGRTTDAAGKSSLSRFLPHASRVSRHNCLQCGNSNCFFFRREVFRRVGQFDTRLGIGSGTGFHSGEETDLLLRAIDAGLGAQFDPDLSVHHDQVDESISQRQIRRASEYGRGFGALLRKHRFSTLSAAYRIGRPLLGAVLGLLAGNMTLARYRWARGRSIAEGYRRWPPPAGSHPFTERAAPYAAQAKTNFC